MAEIAAKSRKFPGNLMKFRRAKIRIRPLLQKTLLQENSAESHHGREQVGSLN